jgi:sarcosine oxidase delta subunit
MIKYIKKLIKKQKLLKKYKKGDKQWNDYVYLLKNFKWNSEEECYFTHQFSCELRCYNRLKKL